MTDMKYRPIEYVDKPISSIIFGCANTAMLQGKKVYRLLDAALSEGINAFDTAEAYGASEEVLGMWMSKRKNRKKLVIISKGCHPHGQWRVNSEALVEDIENSCRRLKTDYIDVYMLHRDHSETNIPEIVETLNEYHQKGFIGAFGASNWTHERIEVANSYAYAHNLIPFTVSSPNFGPAKQIEDPWGGGCVSISGSTNVQARKWYEENKVVVFAYSCLGRGLFSGKVKHQT